jgi:predicted RNase H-like HicB family nuclease
METDSNDKINPGSAPSSNESQEKAIPSRATPRLHKRFRVTRIVNPARRQISYIVGYPVRIKWSVVDHSYIATAYSLPGAAADGPTRRAALRAMRIIIGEWLHTALLQGRSIPPPYQIKNYGGSNTEGSLREGGILNVTAAAALRRLRGKLSWQGDLDSQRQDRFYEGLENRHEETDWGPPVGREIW